LSRRKSGVRHAVKDADKVEHADALFMLFMTYLYWIQLQDVVSLHFYGWRAKSTLRAHKGPLPD
jgi:hypothetical protein